MQTAMHAVLGHQWLSTTGGEQYCIASTIGCTRDGICGGDGSTACSGVGALRNLRLTTSGWSH